MQIDHIVPLAAGGETELDNLCLACNSCNIYKSEFQFGVDPATGQEAHLYHPRKQLWSDHFHWSKDRSRMLGKTSTGRATIERLRINRAEFVASRRDWVDAGLHPPEV